MSTIVSIALAGLGLALGIGVGYVLRKRQGVKAVGSAEAKAQAILDEAKAKERELLLAAKDKAIQIAEEAKRDEQSRRQEISRLQERLEKREGAFDQKLLEIEQQREQLNQKSVQLDSRVAEVQQIKDQQLQKLEKVAGLSTDEAKRVLLLNVEERSKADLLERMQKLEREGVEEVERKAKHLLSLVIQRCASSHVVETTTTTVDLPNDEMKGRIIGREGRNIKSIELQTGVEIIVDETPGAITISGFSPLRRALAKQVLEKLIADGRIHPGRVEETVEEVKKNLASDMRKAGEEAAYQAGVAGLDPKLLQILGRLKYRTSYGQNQLQHALEVSYLSGMLAEELGANVAVAKKGGLLHDIGKAVDQEVQGGHPQIGYDIMKKFGLPEEVAYLAIAHHEDSPKTLEGVIAKVADAISGARPGARKDTLEQYIQRLEELEGIANSFTGVEKTYAIQAGREIRVFVHPDKVDDYTAAKLARDIANRIENELKYPGEIRVTVIREKRVIEYAR